jgi:tight adherence protein B
MQLTLLIFAATALLVAALSAWAYDVFFRYRFLLGDRLDELSGKARRDTNAALFMDLKRLNAQALSAPGGWQMRLEELLEQSGLQIRAPTLLAVSVCLGMTVALIVAAVSKRYWAAPIGFLPGVMAPILFVRFKRGLRMRRLARQLPEAFDVIRRAVRAGQTVPAALQLVADDFEPPISEEFRCCYEQQNLGMPYDTALRNLARRTGIMELRLLVVALLVQSRSGGNLLELLNNLSSMVRKRVTLQQKVKALTGEGRLQATVLIVLPVLAFAILLVISPNYVQSLIQRPWLLAGTMAAQVIGAVWIRKIVNFEF